MHWARVEVRDAINNTSLSKGATSERIHTPASHLKVYYKQDINILIDENQTNSLDLAAYFM